MAIKKKNMLSGLAILFGLDGRPSSDQQVAFSAHLTPLI